MAAEGTVIDPDDVLVTTGGQQVIDLMCKTFIDPGDVIVAEAPTYPGAVPCFSSYQADVIQIGMDEDGMRIDELEEMLDRLDSRGPRAEVRLHDPELPEPRRASRSRCRGASGWSRSPRERELLVLEDNPYGLLQLRRGRAAADAPHAGWRRVRHLPGDVLEDPVGGPARRLGRRAAAGLREAQHGQAGRGPLHVIAGAALRRRTTSAEARLEGLPGRAARALHGAGATSMLDALERHFPARGDVDAARRRAVLLGDAAGLHRHVGPARPGAAGERRVRSGAGRLPRRPRWRVDAPELLRASARTRSARASAGSAT